MSGERPWWLKPAIPALGAALVLSTASFGLTYSPIPQWSRFDPAVQLAILMALARHLAGVEDAHRDVTRPRSLNRWGAPVDTPEPSLFQLSRPLAGFLLAVAVFAALGYMAQKSDVRLWTAAMLGFLLVLIFVNAAGWKPMERIAHEWWPAVRYRWPVTMRLLALFLLAALLASGLVDVIAEGPSLGQPITAGVAAIGCWWLLRSLLDHRPETTATNG